MDKLAKCIADGLSVCPINVFSLAYTLELLKNEENGNMEQISSEGNNL